MKEYDGNRKCAMYGRSTSNILLLHRVADDNTYDFDSKECAKTFKKFYKVYRKRFTSFLD